MNSTEISKLLIDIEAVRLNFETPFRWVSGIQSPIYCDNRLVISSVEGRKAIAKSFADKIKSEFPDTELIAGTATAGIPHAAWVADEMKLPMLYVRSKPKEHGTKSQIEGKFSKAQKVVLIEDLVSTGKSSVAAIKALSAEGLVAKKVYSIFSYELDKADRAFTDAGYSYESLAGVKSLIEYGRLSGFLDEDKTSKLKSFFKELGAN